MLGIGHGNVLHKATPPPPEHPVLIEPFAGGAGYSIRFHQRVDRVILCELDDTLIGLWKYLQKVSPEEIRALPNMEDPDATVDDYPICEEAKWLIGWWLHPVDTKPSKKRSTYAKARGTEYPSYWWEGTKNDIANQLYMLKNWEIHQCSYEDVPYDGDATWFIDPPYQVKGYLYNHGPKNIDFEHLASWCKSRKGQVIVCEQEGADWLPFEPFASWHGSKPGTKTHEVVWYNKQPERF